MKQLHFVREGTESKTSADVWLSGCELDHHDDDCSKHNSFRCRWDIVQTIGVDTRIEDERNEAMMSATLLLMRNLQGNGDVDKSVVDKATQKFKK